MKAALLIALALTGISLHAQVGTSPRTLVRRIEPQVRPQPPRYVPPAQPGVPAAAGATAAKAPLGAKELEQKKLEDAAEVKKKVQWQTERAEKGSDPAQYALGLRYLNGDGVEKDMDKAMKWLKESAKNGNADAKKKLAELEATKPAELKLAPAEPKK